MITLFIAIFVVVGAWLYVGYVSSHMRSKAYEAITDYMSTFEKLVDGNMYLGKESTIVIAYDKMSFNYGHEHRVTYLCITKIGNWFEIHITCLSARKKSMIREFVLNPIGKAKAKKILEYDIDKYREYFCEPAKA